MKVHLVHVGFGNVLAMHRVVAISSPDSAPIKRKMQEAKSNNTMIDLTSGRKTKAVIFLDSGDVVLAALTPETIVGRAAVGGAELAARAAEVEDGDG